MLGIFTQIRPVGIGELESRQKTSKILWLGPIFSFLSAKFFLGCRRQRICIFMFSYIKQKVVLDCFPPSELRISPLIFEKIKNGPIGIIRGLGETDS